MVAVEWPPFICAFPIISNLLLLANLSVLDPILTQTAWSTLSYSRSWFSLFHVQYANVYRHHADTVIRLSTLEPIIHCSIFPTLKFCRSTQRRHFTSIYQLNIAQHSFHPAQRRHAWPLFLRIYARPSPTGPIPHLPNPFPWNTWCCRGCGHMCLVHRLHGMSHRRRYWCWEFRSQFCVALSWHSKSRVFKHKGYT